MNSDLKTAFKGFEDGEYTDPLSGNFKTHHPQVKANSPHGPITVDQEILEFLEHFWKLGYSTSWSCQGDEQMSGYLVVDDLEAGITFLKILLSSEHKAETLEMIRNTILSGYKRSKGSELTNIPSLSAVSLANTAPVRSFQVIFDFPNSYLPNITKAAKSFSDIKSIKADQTFSREELEVLDKLHKCWTRSLERLLSSEELIKSQASLEETLVKIIEAKNPRENLGAQFPKTKVD